MGTRLAIGPASTAGRRMRLGVILLVMGLLGHLLAAHGTGGSRLAYTHHITGFFLLSIVSGALIAALGWIFWRGRHDVTLLLLGATQAILGLVIYIERFRIG